MSSSSITSNGTNSTSCFHQMPPGQTQQVSGQTALWTLIALALNAMTQRSMVGEMTAPDVFVDSLVPHRSSPILCLVDSAIWVSLFGREVVEWCRKENGRGKRKGGREEREVREEGRDKVGSCMSGEEDVGGQIQRSGTKNPAALTMSLVVFFLGVLPQAVKIFAMRGIPITKAFAAVFLFSSIVSAAAGVLRPRARSYELMTFLKKKGENLGEPEETDRKVTPSLWWLFGILAHVSAYLWIWYMIAKTAHIKRVTELGHFTQFVSFIILDIWIILVAQGLTCWTLGWRSRLPQLPGGFCLWLIVLLVINGRSPGANVSASASRYNHVNSICALQLRAVVLGYLAWLVSFGLVWTLRFLAIMAARTAGEQSETAGAHSTMGAGRNSDARASTALKQIISNRAVQLVLKPYRDLIALQRYMRSKVSAGQAPVSTRSEAHRETGPESPPLSSAAIMDVRIEGRSRVADLPETRLQMFPSFCKK